MTHWIENIADELSKMDVEEHVIASGTSISGSIHIGNSCDIFVANGIGKKLRESSMYAKNVSIWIKYSNFVKVSKQMILDNVIHNDMDIYYYATLLFDKLWDKDNYIRALCVGVGSLSNCHDKQLSLFDMEKKDDGMKENDDKLQKAIDDIRKKYGNDKIMYADMIKKKN